MLTTSHSITILTLALAQSYNKATQASYRIVVLKPFLNKTGNHFVETGYLPVIGLRDIMCHIHMAASTGKEGGRPSETPSCNHYVDNGLHEVTRRAQCNQTL